MMDLLFANLSAPEAFLVNSLLIVLSLPRCRRPSASRMTFLCERFTCVSYIINAALCATGYNCGLELALLTSASWGSSPLDILVMNSRAKFSISRMTASLGMCFASDNSSARHDEVLSSI